MFSPCGDAACVRLNISQDLHKSNISAETVYITVQPGSTDVVLVCWLLLFVGCYLLFVVGWWLLVGGCCLVVGWWWFSGWCCWLLLVVVGWLLVVGCCCCCLLVVVIGGELRFSKTLLCKKQKCFSLSF